MPRAGWVKPRDDQRLSDHVALAVLTRVFPPQLVDAVVREAGREQQRRRLLPARLVVYYVLAMPLFSHAGYEEVMRNLVEGLAWESGWRRRWSVPSKSAIFQARARLGSGPLQRLFDRGCVPLAGPDTPGAFYRGWRLVSLDGSTLDMAATPDNEAAFGRPGSGRGEGTGAFPQLRLVVLAECGTHAMFAVAMGPYAAGKVTLAGGLVGSARRGMLLVADRGFTAHPLFAAFAATGADLLWRAKHDAVLPVLERQADGSYRSELLGSNDTRTGERVIPVRVIEYSVVDRSRPDIPGLPDTPRGADIPGRPDIDEERFRLVTTILDPEAAPADQLAALYPQRWEFESALDELKTHQSGPRMMLRSKISDGVRQEAYGLLCTHYAIRALLATAAPPSPSTSSLAPP